MSETNVVVPFCWGPVLFLDSWKILEFAVITKTHLHVDASFFWNTACPFNTQAQFFLSKSFAFHYYVSKRHFPSFWGIAAGRPINLTLDCLHPPSHSDCFILYFFRFAFTIIISIWRFSPFQQWNFYLHLFFSLLISMHCNDIVLLFNVLMIAPVFAFFSFC